MERAEFVAQFGAIYEHSPWVAERAWDAGPPPVVDARALGAALRACVDGADVATQLALLRAHPDLAGRLALAGELGAASSDEQASAGLDQCSAEQLARFTALNARYVERFGFPFIMAVRERERDEILAAFEARVENERASEFANAMEQVHRIAALRLQAWFEEKSR